MGRKSKEEEARGGGRREWRKEDRGGEGGKVKGGFLECGRSEGERRSFGRELRSGM